ncbi:hypothetical protein C471_10986 [Halorubrum saccharovorum DSM 1137]|uniref:Uncharacterized protein n=1 Tax=Halorubrum saccharovorum DSM 1137 TaxID=1227484 RepID=M0DVH0_9EURY|nr:DUF5791 family protein [Halorubrum saccharovorum]ELZ38104.1 hypothetical protein C471_10986 [Halorubrum saccharovorum DSM 1137]
MFHEVVVDGTTGAESDADEVTAATLLAAFEALVNEAAAEVGHDRIAEEAGIDGAAIDAVIDGNVSGLRLEDGAAIVAVSADRDGDAVVAEVRDHLLMGMATAVLDVDSIAAAIDADLTGQEVQQALEGRAPMTLGQLAEIMAVIERRKP